MIEPKKNIGEQAKISTRHTVHSLYNTPHYNMDLDLTW